jgi:predicted AAA+ superfamily ATPase
LRTNNIITVTGIRRSGKSTLIRQFAKKLIENNLYKKEEILIVNFEDYRFSKYNYDVFLLEKIYETYIEYFRPEKTIIFLDEIQRIKDWEKWVRTFYELNKGKIVITGSTSKILKPELGTLLTGRHIDIEVFPLSFLEFLEFKKIRISNQLDIINNKLYIKRLFDEYIKFGGLPEVVLSENKVEILQEYFDDIINRDIIFRYKIRKINSLIELAKYYITNIASHITFRSIEKFIDINKDTIEAFSKYLEEVGLIFFVYPFSFSLKEQYRLPRKVYTIDNGFSYSLGFRISENIGRLMENLVAIELLRRKSYWNKNWEIYYFKKNNEYEIDFLIKEGINIKQLIQVSYINSENDLKDPELYKREIESLLKGYKSFKEYNPELIIISWDYEDILKVNDREIKVIPLWKWLLNI